MKKVFSLSLLALALLGASGSALAGYAQLAAPAGWTQGSGAASTFNFSKTAANSATFLNNTVRTNAGLNVGGRAITMPVAMRFAANAGRVGAAASYGNPGLFALLAVGSVGYAAYEWYLDSDVEVKDGKWVKKTITGGIVCASNCYEFLASDIWYRSNETALRSILPAIKAYNGYKTIDFKECLTPQDARCYFTYTLYNTNMPGTFTDSYLMTARAIPPYDTRSTRYDELTRQQFEDEMAPVPLPNAVPANFPVPVEWPLAPLPIVNPSPGVNPVPQPLRVPQGDPQPVPDSDPPAWKTPVIDVVPSPTVDSPWRVDLQPKEITKLDPSPESEAAPVPQTPASGTTATPTKFETCGLPGTPQCKIDETGTAEPITDSKYDPKVDAIKTAQDAARELVKAPSDKSFFNDWSVFFTAPAVAACTPFVLPRDMGAIDPCPVVEGVRSIMAYIWALTAMFLCLGMIKKVI